MNFIDWIIFAVVGMGVIKGLTDGLVRQMVSLIGIILGSWVAIHYTEYTGKLLLTIYDFPVYIWKPLSFFLPFILIIILANLLATIFQKVLSGIGLGPLNQVAGAIFGGIKMILLTSIALNLYQQLDNRNYVLKLQTKENSITYFPVLKVSPTIFPYLQKYFKHENEIPIKDKKEVV